MVAGDLAPKTIVIFGITGTQGSSVARSFVSQSGWTMHGVTRKPSSPAAVQWEMPGIEIAYGDLDDAESLCKALRGANIVFGVTDFWQHLKDPKALIDAVAATLPDLERFIISTLSSARDASEGAIDFNLHFDSKAEMLKHLKKRYPELWAKTSLLTLGCYAGNWKLYKDGAGRPGKIDDGVYKIYLPRDGDTPLPFVEPNADTDPFVKALLNLLSGTNLVEAGSPISWAEWCNIWGRVNDVKCTFERQDLFEEHSYCGVDGKNVVYPWDLSFKVKYTTMEEYIQSQDWDSVLCPEGGIVEAP
ncbi:NAD(P)-binding protein [Didymella exigua CBS 183.55]|uniref:NAD(P)-binding protein n=1 Tax=Didymella exigua CBS 183.55 TaxID=1150837 RepID=A0A6A5RP89_9PLEO|nr:NAD(P)-binding protein [Didymella exigua CBS 183.55]KAF1927327.1 NAD(P)-binding protein [Didymella exigua CBS 183.55]